MRGTRTARRIGFSPDKAEVPGARPRGGGSPVPRRSRTNGPDRISPAASFAVYIAEDPAAARDNLHRRGPSRERFPRPPPAARAIGKRFSRGGFSKNAFISVCFVARRAKYAVFRPNLEHFRNFRRNFSLFSTQAASMGKGERGGGGRKKSAARRKKRFTGAWVLNTIFT